MRNLCGRGGRIGVSIDMLAAFLVLIRAAGILNAGFGESSVRSIITISFSIVASIAREFKAGGSGDVLKPC